MDGTSNAAADGLLQESNRLDKNSNKLRKQAQSIEKRLSLAGYMAKTPPHVQDKDRDHVSAAYA